MRQILILHNIDLEGIARKVIVHHTCVVESVPS